MKFGLFYQLPSAPTQHVVARYQETIEQIVYAEALGFDAAWLAELHFNPLFSVMPARYSDCSFISWATFWDRSSFGS